MLLKLRGEDSCFRVGGRDSSGRVLEEEEQKGEEVSERNERGGDGRQVEVELEKGKKD